MTITLLHGDSGDVLKTLPEQSAQVCVTSPPYWCQRRYTDDPREIGREPTIAEYVAALVAVLRAVWPVLTDDGTLWLNVGDAYANDTKWGGASGNKNDTSAAGGYGGQRMRRKTGLPPKSLIGLPWRVAFALQDAGWVLRSEIIWHKTTCAPESVKDRPSRTHEHIFLFSKSPHYFCAIAAIAESTTASARPQYRRAIELARAAGLTPAHFDAIRAVGLSDAGKARAMQTGAGKNTPAAQALADEAKAVLGGYYRELLTGPTRNAGSVWHMPTGGLPDEHYAPYPDELPRRCILAGSRPGDTVLDPFAGSGTTMRVAEILGRNSIGIDLGYQALQERRTDGLQISMEAFL